MRMIQWTSVILVCFSVVNCLHLKGTWRTSEEFLHLLAKFGFQRTNQHDRTNTQGHIFGNITSTANVTSPVTFVVVDKTYFGEYYENKSLQLKNEACAAMFKKIDSIAYDATCHPNNIEDFLRRIPCPKGKYCVDEDQPQFIVPGYQFTYGVQDINQPRFWYVSMVSCHRTANCTWVHESDLDVSIDYDIWLVNGNPYTRHQNPFEYQFSFEHQDTVEIYLMFAVLYLGLVSIQVYVALQQRHPLTYLFTGSMALQLLGNVFHLIHLLIYAYDGEGVKGVGITGDVCDIFSQTAFVLVLLLLAKGWAVTHREPTWKRLLLGIWIFFLIANIILYIWSMMEVEIIKDKDVYQTWPGWLSLSLRIIIMMWFLCELKWTMQRERNKAKLQFLLHFGASSLVWFIYLPIMAIVAITISTLWRFKLVLGISSSVNFLAFASMTHLLWPVRHESYVHLSSSTTAASDELEEFTEAPHVVNQKNYFIRHAQSLS